MNGSVTVDIPKRRCFQSFFRQTVRLAIKLWLILKLLCSPSSSRLNLCTKVFALAFLVVGSLSPLVAHASVFSFLEELMSPKASAQESRETAIGNSQTIELLRSALNSDPNPAKGGGDIAIVGGVALLPESGPSGTIADISGGDAHGSISVYMVRSGDTLSQIAKMFGVSVNTIVWANNINSGIIRPGDSLVILPISGVQHIVKKGDTLASIAKKYSADAREVALFNNLSENAKLAVGDEVIIPDGEMAVSASFAPASRVRGAGGPTYEGYYLRPILGGRKTQGLHGYNGIDLANYYGAPVFASAEGEVIVARYDGWNGGYGKYIVVAHPNGTQTLYSHLSQVLTYVGRQVPRGELIGNIGSTGNSTGPHLHFEIRGAKNPF
ncbi:MAG: Peptidase M23 family protein [Parcubacteria group bacterium GW2011_GWA2_47_12]|nr:MAG: Peptidase M23 family protein [Parcubacteria group bacterium GW2011_GWA2_47_12]